MAKALQWEPISDDEHWWTQFEERFAFTPRFRPGGQPAIDEPAESVTFSLDPICSTGSEPTFVVGTDALNAEVLRAFVDVFEPEERLVVLDWQHPSYYFRPHLHAIASQDWQVTPFPDGDYYIFITEDLSTGTFGHPWEESLCVFGSRLVDTLVPTLERWLPVLRCGGVPV